MSAIAHDPDSAAGRLTLALLLALGLHAALLFGVPAEGWSIGYPKPLRFDVTLLPPAARPNLPEPPAAAPAEPEAKPGVSAVVVEPEPVVSSPEPMVERVPPPTPIPPSEPVTATKPTPQPSVPVAAPVKPPAPAKPPVAAKTTPAPQAAVKPATPPKPAKPPAPPAKPAHQPPTAAEPFVKPPAVKPPTAPLPAAANRQPTVKPPASRSERPGSGGGTGARGRLDSSALLGQIAGLEAETGRKAAAGIRAKRISPSDTQSPEGFYIAAWTRKVEQIGEMNFPEVARKLNLNTGPVLDVAIRADGSLQDVRVVRSSGHAELDQAAQRIVRLGAPYAPFPPQLRQRYDVLQISRPWRFDPGGRVRAR